MIIILITIIFVGMISLPLSYAYWIYKKENVDVLYINQNKTRNPRYFAIYFSNMIKDIWEDFDKKGILYLSKYEKIIEADTTKFYSNPCKCVIVAKNNDFKPPSEIIFEKEIYAKQNAILRGAVKIRAIACKKNLDIGYNIEILRWADAIGRVTIKDNCYLGICISSLTEIIIGVNCSFRRLYAPKIYLGQYLEKLTKPKKSVIFKAGKFNLLNSIKLNIKDIDDTMLDDDGIANFSVVSKYDCTVLEDIILNGHIRSHKSIRICDNSIIVENVFAEGNIKIGKNVCILGSVFSQSDIIIESGTVIGQENKVSSVIARGFITFEENCIVYGYICNECGGKIYSKFD